MTRKGYTLIELIIALALTLTLTGTMIFAFGQGLRGWKRTVGLAERAQLECLVLDRLARDVRAAEEIKTASGSEEIQLTIDGENVNYFWQEAKLGRKKGSSVAYLTSEGEIDKPEYGYPARNIAEIKIGKHSARFAARNAP